MSLFSPDLYRNFAIGFVAGALAIGVAHAANGGDTFESPAQAASPLEAPQPSDEFLIEPVELDL